MFRRFFTALAFCGGIVLSNAAHAGTSSPTGSWLTASRDAVVFIAPCGVGLCGHIAGIKLDHPSDPQPLDWRGQPQCGDAIIAMAPSGTPGKWHGTITDPRSGSVWRATLTLHDGNLHLRGYVGLPLFGETQTWTRYHGQINTGCLITTAG